MSNIGIYDEAGCAETRVRAIWGSKVKCRELISSLKTCQRVGFSLMELVYASGADYWIAIKSFTVRVGEPANS